MKVIVYRLDIYHKGHCHQQHRFIGRIPTVGDVLAAIRRRRDGSLAYTDVQEEFISEEIVKAIGIPGAGDLPNSLAWEKTWRVIDVEVGKLYLKKEEVWSLKESE